MLSYLDRFRVLATKHQWPRDKIDKAVVLLEREHLLFLLVNGHLRVVRKKQLQELLDKNWKRPRKRKE
jgi:hypothetical protein